MMSFDVSIKDEDTTIAETAAITWTTAGFLPFIHINILEKINADKININPPRGRSDTGKNLQKAYPPMKDSHATIHSSAENSCFFAFSSGGIIEYSCIINLLFLYLIFA